jgi:hypothetical protein
VCTLVIAFRHAAPPAGPTFVVSTTELRLGPTVLAAMPAPETWAKGFDAI